MTTQNLEAYVSRDTNLIVTVVDQDSVAVDLSGSTVSYTIEDDDGVVQVTKTSATSSEISTSSNVVTVYINPSDMTTPDVYLHEMKITDASGNVVQVMDGSIHFKEVLH